MASATHITENTRNMTTQAPGASLKIRQPSENQPAPRDAATLRPSPRSPLSETAGSRTAALGGAKGLSPSCDVDIDYFVQAPRYFASMCWAIAIVPPPFGFSMFIFMSM